MANLSPWPPCCHSCQDKRGSIIECGNPAVVCPDCDGSGLERCGRCRSSLWEDCPSCTGTGKCGKCGASGTLMCPKCDGSGRGRMFRVLSVTCKMCSGKGRVQCYWCHGTHKCRDCGGTAKRQCTLCGGTGRWSIKCPGCRGDKSVHDRNCLECGGRPKKFVVCPACESDPWGIKQVLNKLGIMEPGSPNQKTSAIRGGNREPYQFQPMTLEQIAEAVVKEGRPIVFSANECTIHFVMVTGKDRVIDIQRIGQDQFLGHRIAEADGGSWHWDLADEGNPWSIHD